MFRHISEIMTMSKDDPAVLLTDKAAAMLRSVHKTEDETAFHRSFQFPIYWWAPRVILSHDDRHLIGTRVSRWMMTDPAAQTAEEKMRIASLLSRFSASANYGFLSGVSAETLPLRLLFDFILIQAARRNWARLYELSRLWLARASANEPHFSYVCDFNFWACFHSRKSATAGKPASDNIPTPKQAISALERLAGRPEKNIHIYKGLQKCLDGNVRGSVADFVAANNTAGRTTEFFRPSEHVMPVEALADLRTRALAPADDAAPWHSSTVKHTFRHTPSSGCLLLSADHAYFQRFFANLCESFAHNTPAGTIHLHCVGFEPESMVLDQFEASHGIKINVSVDHSGPKGINPDLLLGENASPAQKHTSSELFLGHCITARYIWLPFYLERYSFVAISDIDGVIVRDISTLWDGRDDSNAILLGTTMNLQAAHSTGALWGNISAGAFAVKSHPNHKAFARMASYFMHARMAAARDRGEKCFYADQAGLMLCFLTMQHDCSFDRLKGRFFAQGDSKNPASRATDKKNRQARYLAQIRKKT